MPMVLITCPRTRQPVPTGIVLDTQAFIWANLRQQRTHCTHCNRIHRWSKEDAYLPGQPPKPAPGRFRHTLMAQRTVHVPWEWLAVVATIGIVGAAWYFGVGPGQHWIAGLRP